MTDPGSIRDKIAGIGQAREELRSLNRQAEKMTACLRSAGSAAPPPPLTEELRAKREARRIVLGLPTAEGLRRIARSLPRLISATESNDAA